MQMQYEPGRYWCKVTGQAMGKSKAGNAQFILSFAVVGKVDPSDPGGELIACPKNERRMFLTITEKTGEYVIEDLKRLGYQKQSFKFLDPERDGYHDFTGHEFEARCDPNEYEGKTTEKWRVASDGYKPEPPDANDIKKLDMLFGKQLKEAFPAEKPQRSAGPPASTEEVVSAAKDDIPF